MTRRIMAGMLVAALFASGTALGEDKDDKKSKAVKYAKPEDAFDAFVKAMKKNDLKAAHATLTPDSADRMLAELIVGTQIMKALATAFDKTGKAAEAFKSIDEVLDRHGIKAEKLEETLKEANKVKDDRKKTAALLAKLLEPVKDRAALVGDLGAKLDKVGGMKKKDFPEAKLSDVKTDGDTATGKLTLKEGDKEDSQTLTFKKIKGSWLIELPEGFGRPKARAPKGFGD